MNVLSILAEVARRHPDRPALILGSRAIAFSALRERIDRASAGLQREGLQPGDRAIVMIPMSIDLYAALLAVLKIGAVAVFVDPWIGRRQIAAFAAFAGPRAWLGIPASHLLRLLAPGLRSIPITVTTGRRLGGLPARHTLAELAREPGDGH
ncbi:MAG: AMP-binding protein, partial [Thermoanaerobaculia bacterium]